MVVGLLISFRRQLLKWCFGRRQSYFVFDEEIEKIVSVFEILLLLCSSRHSV